MGGGGRRRFKVTNFLRKKDIWLELEGGENRMMGREKVATKTKQKIR
jgi:hypothetical protein